MALFGATTATVTAVGMFAVAAATVFSAVALVIAVYVSPSPNPARSRISHSAKFNHNRIVVIILVVWLIVDAKKSPPPSDLEIWMTDQGKLWAESRPAPVDPVKVSLSPSSSYSSDLQTICATFTSNTGNDVELSSISLQFPSGSVGGAFFAEKKPYVNRSDVTAGRVKVDGLPSGCTMRVLNLQNAVVKEHMDTTLIVSRPKTADDKTDQTFKLSYNRSITITAAGVVQDDSSAPCSMAWQVFTKDEEITNGQLDATRVKKP